MIGPNGHELWDRASALPLDTLGVPYPLLRPVRWLLFYMLS